MQSRKKYIVIVFALTFVLFVGIELFQSSETLEDLYKTTLFISGDLGIETWNTSEKWDEGRKMIACLCGIPNKHESGQRWVHYGNVYFLDGDSAEFQEIMIELADMKWEDPKREKIVNEISKWRYEYYIGGKPWTFLFQTKGIVVNGDVEKVKAMLGSY